MTKNKKPSTILKLQIKGPGVTPGRISVPDLLTICTEAQSAIQRQAEAIEGKSTLRRGPRTSKAKIECTLELVQLRRGSTTLGFAIAKPQELLPDQMSLGKDAVIEVARTVKLLSKKNNGKREIDSGVLDSLNKMSEVMRAKKITSIKWMVPKFSGTQKIIANLDKTTAENISKLSMPPTSKDVVIEGRLEMADFKPSDQKSRLHPLVGNPVICTFSKDQEELIYLNLRKNVRLCGKASINSQTGRTESVEIRELKTVEPLFTGEKDFFSAKSFDELVAAQGVKPLDDINSLAGLWPEGEDPDQFLSEIYKSREI